MQVELSAERKAVQKAVDASLLKAAAPKSAMRKYLGAKFSLTRGQLPHEMKF